MSKAMKDKNIYIAVESMAQAAVDAVNEAAKQIEADKAAMQKLTCAVVTCRGIANVLLIHDISYINEHKKYYADQLSMVANIIADELEAKKK